MKHIKMVTLWERLMAVGMGKTWENNKVKHKRGLAKLVISEPQIEQ